MESETAGEGAALDLGFIDEASRERAMRQRTRARTALALSGAVTVVWALYVTASGQWDRVIDNWASGVTMIFGSFVAGSTPQGGGAVGFPVFTKALEVPTAVARSFALSIQAVGMGTAALAIIVNRRQIEWRAILLGGSAALVGFFFTLFVLSHPDEPFWPSRIPGDYVKVTFTLVLAAMSFVVYLGTRVLIRKVDVELPPMNARLYTALLLAGVVGGVASALTGSGADVLLYMFIVVLFGLDPRVGIPSSVVVMGAISVISVLVLGVADGQLSVLLEDGRVASVGGDAVTGVESNGELVAVQGAGGEALPANRFDLFGLWLAAVPFAGWFGALGSWAASRATARQLVMFVLSLAAIEVVSTVVFLDGLHEPGPLLAYAVVGLVVALTGFYLLARYRRTIFRLPGLSPEETFSRGHLDVAPGYVAQLEESAPAGEGRNTPDDGGPASGEPDVTESETRPTTPEHGTPEHETPEHERRHEP